MSVALLPQRGVDRVDPLMAAEEVSPVVEERIGLALDAAEVGARLPQEEDAGLR